MNQGLNPCLMYLIYEETPEKTSKKQRYTIDIQIYNTLFQDYS